MSDQSQPPVEASSLRDQLASVRQGLAQSPVRNTILLSIAAILAVILATAGGQLLLNRWNQPFYDALQRRDLPAFLNQLMIFGFIAGGLLVLNIAQQWLNQRIRLRLREALTSDLVGEWMRPSRAFRLANAGAIGVNPDQRMQQDAGHLSDLTTDLGIGLLQAFILLVSFVGVLWSLSSGFVFHYDGREIAIPGYMVWAAFLYAGTASWLSWLVGRPLIRLNGERYAREAELRFSMVRVNENIDAIALARGETGEKRRLLADLGAVLAAMLRIYGAQINLGWVTDTYGWITVVAPIVIASPIYFSGDLSFGGLMMAVGAFNQVHSSLRWFVNNIGGIADWRATLMRVADFRMALNDAETLHGSEKRIVIDENETQALTFDRLEVSSPAGCTRLSEDHIQIGAGDRVLVTGEPNAGKTLFFRAMAGLWPWGAGRIGMPKGKAPFFLPRTPYFPPGTLREVLGATKKTKDGDIAAILGELGLNRLGGSLERSARWDRELNEDDQRLLAFAQLAVIRPKWIVIDETLDTFDARALAKVQAFIEKRLGKATIIGIGRARRNDRFFGRTLTIVKDDDAPALKAPRLRAGAVEPPPSDAPKRKTETDKK